MATVTIGNKRRGAIVAARQRDGFDVRQVQSNRRKFDFYQTRYRINDHSGKGKWAR
jgi:hypothetical protein